MIALIIIGFVVLLLALVMFIPVGADVSYIDGDIKVSAKVCGQLLQIIPKKEADKKKEPKAKKEKKQKAKKEKLTDSGGVAEPKKKLNLNLEEIFDILKAALGGIGRFGRKINVDRFLLHYTAAGKDPFRSAVNFGYVNAGLCALAPLCSRRFDVKDLDVHTEIDFLREKADIDAAIALSIRIGQVVWIALCIAFSALTVLIRSKKRLKAEANKTSLDNKTEVNNQNIQADERTNNNGQ